MKKITKKRIQEVLRTENVTLIHNIASKCGINSDNWLDVMRFIEKYAPTKRVYNLAYNLTANRSVINYLKKDRTPVRMPIHDAVNFMRIQIKEGVTPYYKVLVEGNKNFYWCSPAFLHSDYNKSRAFENTPKNRRIAELINNCLTKL